MLFNNSMLSLRTSAFLNPTYCLFAALLFASAVRAHEIGVERVDNLRCTLLERSGGQELKLQMSLPHGGDLAIKSPDGTYFTVVHRRATAAVRPGLLMSAEDFEKLETLRLPVASLKGVPLGETAAGQKLVFSTSGEYEITVATELYSDAWPTISTCLVKYQQR